MLAFLKLVPWWVWPVLMLAVFTGAQWARADHLAAELVTYKQAAKTYQAAQVTNLATIQTLQNANTKWAETYKARVALAQSYINANIQYQNELNAQLATTRKQLGVIYASHPEAKLWASQPVPGAIADQLRHNATSH